MEQLRKEISHCLLQQDADDWEIRLNQADIPAARVRDLHDMLAREQGQRGRHSQFKRFPDRQTTAPIAAFRFAEGGPDFDAHCSRHGEDTHGVLIDLGYDVEQIASFAREGVITPANSDQQP